MERAKAILQKLLHPPKGVLLGATAISFTALGGVLATDLNHSVLAYLIYGMSAYSLIILLAALPEWGKQIKFAVQNSRTARKIASYEMVGRYWNDLAFRGSVSIYRGMAVNFFYVIFRIVAGIRYTSVWFISMAVYYLVLGGLRVYLIACYRHRSPEAERRCYRRTAWLLFLLNISMGGMILQMVRMNSGFSYPGSIIYLSALYTFYTLAVAVVNLVKFRRLGSPILSAAKVLNLISAMMSILGLQTAMISRFSENGENFRQTMNSLTGGAVYGIVIGIALYMLLHGKTMERKAEAIEQVGK